MNWKPHYTGIETVQCEYPNGAELYLQRYMGKQCPRFIRIFLPWVGMGGCLFLGHLNQCQHFGKGIEFHAMRGRPWPHCLRYLLEWHVGLITSKFPDYKVAKVRWSGSMVDPYRGVSFRVWRFCFGLSLVPQWIQNIQRRRMEKRWEEEAAFYDQHLKRHYGDQEGVPHEPAGTK